MATELAWQPLDRMLADGMAQHTEQQYAESAPDQNEVPLAVDWATYRTLEIAGILRLLAAHRAGALVGYAAFLVMPHLMYSRTLHAMNDSIYVAPRGRMIGLGLCDRLVARAEHDFRAEVKGGPMRVIYDTGTTGGARGLDAILERRGYEQIGKVWRKLVRPA